MANAKCDHCGHVCDQASLYPADYVDPHLDRPRGAVRFVEPLGECPLCGHLAYAPEEIKS